MIKKIWNGPVTQFFGGKARTYADEPYARNVEMSKAFEAPYSQPIEMTEAEYNKEIFGVYLGSTPVVGSARVVGSTYLQSPLVPGEPIVTLTPELKKQLEQIDGKVAATKHDGGKTDWSLLPWDAVEEIIKVLQFGAGKYSPWNWAENGGFKFNRLFNSSMRHFVAWFWRREDLDPETGLSHMAHLGCNVLFLLHYVLNGNKFKNNDNRPNVS